MLHRWCHQAMQWLDSRMVHGEPHRDGYSMSRLLLASQSEPGEGEYDRNGSRARELLVLGASAVH